MKKFYHCILIVVCALCFLLLAACNHDSDVNDDYIADNEHCVVSLPRDYYISFNNYETAAIFDKDLYNAKTVNGKEKKDGFIYYNVPKNEPFRILTPLGIIQNKNENGQTLVYWKLNDIFYKDCDNYYSANIFNCNQDTEITPVYYEFRPVGMLLYEVDKNNMPTVPNGEFFDNEGNIKEQIGVHYLYGVYDFEPYKNFWRTNLTLNKFVINETSKMVTENYYKNIYTLNIEIESSNIFENGKIIVETLYKIDGHGYMTYGSKHIISGDETRNVIHSLSIGEHELKFTFN